MAGDESGCEAPVEPRYGFCKTDPASQCAFVTVADDTIAVGSQYLSKCLLP